MLAKKFRLQTSEVKNVLSTGSTHRSRLFIVRAQKAPEFNEATEVSNHKFATVISKKMSKKAVVRNLLRRQIYDIIRLNKNILEKSDKLQIILIPKKNCLEQTYKELETDIIFILQNIEKWLKI